MTIFVFALIGSLALYIVAQPLWQYIRRPWSFDAPRGDEETIRQEQISALEALRDLAMDYRLGQLSATDYRALAAPLQQRARRTLQQQTSVDDAKLVALDAALEAEILSLRRVQPATNGAASTSVRAARFCPQCGEGVSPTHRFCAGCGTKLPEFKPTAGVVSTAQPNGHTGKAQRSVTDSVSKSEVSSTQVQNAKSDTPLTHTSPKRATAPRASARASHLWWGIAAVIATVWVVGVVWFYVSSRVEQETQVPIATLPVGQIQALAVANDTAMLGASDSIQRSVDGGNWNALPIDDTILSLAALDQQSWLAAGVQGLWRSDDGGNQWQQVVTDPTNLQLVALSVMAGDSNLIWGAGRTTLYISHDGGITWDVANRSLPGQVQALAAGRSDLFLGTDRGVFLSRSRGNSWVDYNGQVNGRIGSTDIQALTYDPTGNLIFAGTPLGLFFMNLASPGGWGQRTLDANVTALALTGSADEVLWVGTFNGQIFRSENRGVNWR